MRKREGYTWNYKHRTRDNLEYNKMSCCKANLIYLDQWYLFTQIRKTQNYYNRLYEKKVREKNENQS